MNMLTLLIPTCTVVSIGMLFYLTVVANHYPLAHLMCKTFMCNEQCVVRRDACLQAEGKHVQDLL